MALSSRERRSLGGALIAGVVLAVTWLSTTDDYPAESAWRANELLPVRCTDLAIDDRESRPRDGASSSGPELQPALFIAPCEARSGPIAL